MSCPETVVLEGSVASAGAKVLVTGGYLVLERPNTGIVLSVNAQLHSSVFPLPVSSLTSNNTDSDGSVTYPIVVFTPQRCHAPLSMAVTYPAPGNASGLALSGDLAANSFVVTTLQHVLSAVQHELGADKFVAKLAGGLVVHVRGDRSFYSSLPIASQSTKSGSSGRDASNDNKACSAASSDSANAVLPLDNDDPADYTTKTGLGSSAAVVCSLVAALFAHFGFDVSAPSSPDRLLAYRLAQFAHCAAQGKVGSGFDVAAAFFGTHIYTRFSPRVIAPFLSATAPIPAAALVAMLKQSGGGSDDAQQAGWDDTAAPFVLPPGLQLLLGDVQGGSETPSMVKSILHWRATAPGAEAEWQAQAHRNAAVERAIAELIALYDRDGAGYDAGLALCAKHTWRDWDTLAVATAAGSAEASGDGGVAAATVRAMHTLASRFALVRAGLRSIGDAAGVPVEPTSQTRLLDATEAVPGVVLSGVPGAGGYDAIFALVVSRSVAGEGGEVVRVWGRNAAPRAATAAGASAEATAGAGAGEDEDVNQTATGAEEETQACVRRLPVELAGPGGVTVGKVSKMFDKSVLAML